MNQALAKAPRLDLALPDVPAASPSDATSGPLALFWRDSRRSVLVAAYKLATEYLTFFAAVGFALFLATSRVPMALLDRALGSRLRERFIDLIARISPG